MRIEARGRADGYAAGVLVVLSAPLSLWGGFDPTTGAIIDAGHPQCGQLLSGRVLAMASARGSSSSSSALVEAARLGTAPAGIVLGRPDAILLIGSLVAADLYAHEIPILLIGELDWPRLRDGARVEATSRDGEASLAEMTQP